MKSLKKQLAREIGHQLAVTFDDPASVTGWQEWEDAAGESVDTHCTAYGILIKVHQRYIRIAHISGRDGQVADTFTIPKNAITRVEKVAKLDQLWPKR